jgi:hypothetical protein
VADALSRLELTSEPMEDLFFTEELRSEFYCYDIEDMDSDDYPLTYESIGKAQSSDKDILKELQKDKPKYELLPFHAAGKMRELVCHNEKIVIPKAKHKQVVEWYHHYLGHPGINRTEEKISQHLWWPTMRDYITNSVNSCAICQQNKKQKIT